MTATLESDEPADAPRARSGWRLSLRQGMALVAVAGLLAAAVVPLVRGVNSAREAAAASQCLCNLCQIKLALQNYHDANGHFPPAFIADENGRPMHSWRVLILPYLEQQQLFGLYDFSEPWDGPHNSTLASRMPAVYACPNHRGPQGNIWTDYVAVTGPSTVFPGAATTKLSDIKDGAANTVMVVEAANLNVPWMAPIDLDTRTMSYRINDPTRPSLSAFDRAGPAIVTADAAYYRLNPRTTSQRFVEAIMTIAGDEPVDWDDRRW